MAVGLSVSPRLGN
ncbi:L-2-hydroxyglutarate oxidase LhgO, partial [Vibrio cholerae HC-50A1]